MNRVWLAIALMVFVAGCKPEQRKTASRPKPTVASPVAADDDQCKLDEIHCDPVAESVADVMQQRFGSLSDYSATEVWIHHEYNARDLKKYQRAIDRVDKIAVWAEGLEPGRTRSAYLALTDSYRKAMQESIAEIHTKSEKQEMEEYERHERECAALASKYKSTHKLPEPPE